MGYLCVRGVEGPLRGTIGVPPSKYHAHRALILGSLAPGTTRIVGRSDAKHVWHTVRALRLLGAEVEETDEGYAVRGGSYRPQRERIPLGSCGSLAYFIIGLGCLSESPVTFDAEKQLRNRPIGALLEGLRRIGVHLEASGGGRLPVTVYPGRPKGGRVEIEGTLSQWISGLLMVAPLATGDTVIDVVGEINERHYLDLTVRMLERFGIEVGVSPDHRRFEVPGDQNYRHRPRLVLSSDVSSAAYGLAAASMHPSDLLFTATRSCDDHPERAIFDVLAEMGLPMDFADDRRELRVVHDGSPLRGMEIDCTDFPDALPALCAVAALAEGRTVFENVAHARRKESDRVRASLQLTRMGARMSATEDTIVVEGVRGLRGQALSSFNDHRILMSLAVAGGAAEGETRLTFPNAYRISYPRFLEDMNGIGLSMRVEQRTRATTHA
ncbi:3-phosphoshikimate 1-carboxyvinyltransferase [Rubrobacter calidifluminis]|uniref:3-phosphoshikimate 1-carboxyvinyltransferase n=1 Tax=Rubrobacter calidifluminis TaxID=1392640 RepID=UPI0023600439|nr:3-phosphoshikimate 1-carboxyvinyltransferase [Rubrobacter calidifluminis]